MGLAAVVSVVYGVRVDLSHKIQRDLEEEDDAFDNSFKMMKLMDEITTELSIDNSWHNKRRPQFFLIDDDDLTSGFMGFEVEMILNTKASFNVTELYRLTLDWTSRLASDAKSRYDETLKNMVAILYRGFEQVASTEPELFLHCYIE